MTKKVSTTLILIVLILKTVNGQNFKNLDFQQKCDSSKTGLCYWDLSWGGKKFVKAEIIDKKNVLAISGQDENSVGFVEQEAISTDTSKVKILSISSFVKSEGIIGKGAGLNIGLYDEWIL